MDRKNTIIRGTFLLTAAGIIAKIIGFYYRIFLNNQIGAAGLGLYQLIFPVFVMGLAFCCVGLQTSLSRMIAANEDNYSYCVKILYTAVFYSTFLAAVVMIICYFNSEYIAINFLKNEYCSPLVKILSFAFIPAAIHSCISGYYYGKKKTFLPAVSQLVEQISRVVIVYLLFKLPIDKIESVVWGLVIGEGFGAILSITYFFFEKDKKRLVKQNKNITKELFSQAIPLTFNRIGTNLLQSVESVIFPLLLCQYGYSNEEALAFLGILTGMALPLIMFPSALTNSLSVLLLSDVANSKSKQNKAQIRKTVEYTIECTMLLGIFCLGFFFINGDKIGLLIFNSKTAGYYIRIMAFLSPFVYISSVLGSIVHGLGKTFIYFIFNLVTMLIKLVLMWCFMPVYGVKVYVDILLITMLSMCIFLMFILRSEVKYKIHLYEWIVKPVIYMFAGFWVVIFCELVIKKAGILHPAVILSIDCMGYCIPFMFVLKKGYGLIKPEKNL